MRGRLARSEIIQGVETKTSDERQAAAVNTTTSLDRDQILDLCELIHTTCPGELPAAGSRTLGLFRCIQIHFVDIAAQSHPGVAGRHPHGLPIHHLKSGGGLHPFDRRTPPSVDTSGGGPRPGPPIHHRRHSGALLVMARPSRTVLRQTPHHRSEPASGLHPGRTPSMDLPTPAG